MTTNAPFAPHLTPSHPSIVVYSSASYLFVIANARNLGLGRTNINGRGAIDEGLAAVDAEEGTDGAAVGGDVGDAQGVGDLEDGVVDWDGHLEGSVGGALEGDGGVELTLGGSGLGEAGEESEGGGGDGEGLHFD